MQSAPHCWGDQDPAEPCGRQLLSSRICGNTGAWDRETSPPRPARGALSSPEPVQAELGKGRPHQRLWVRIRGDVPVRTLGGCLRLPAANSSWEPWPGSPCSAMCPHSQRLNPAWPPAPPRRRCRHPAPLCLCFPSPEAAGCGRAPRAVRLPPSPAGSQRAAGV